MAFGFADHKSPVSISKEIPVVDPPPMSNYKGALALAASKVDCNAGEELTSQARVCFSYYTMFILSFLVLTTCNVDDSDCKADAQTNIGRL